MKTLRDAFRISLFRDVFDFPAPILGNLVQQKPVWRAAKSHREDPSVRMPLHLGDDLHVVADLPVRHKTSDANVVLSIRWLERRANGLHHFRASVSVSAGEELLRPGDVFGSGRLRIRKKNLRVAGKK